MPVASFGVDGVVDKSDELIRSAGTDMALSKLFSQLVLLDDGIGMGIDAVAVVVVLVNEGDDDDVVAVTDDDADGSTDEDVSIGSLLIRFVVVVVAGVMFAFGSWAILISSINAFEVDVAWDWVRPAWFNLKKKEIRKLILSFM